MPQPSIAIIGGGPGGLTLARILLQGGILASVFEMDASPDTRNQGGSLDIHTETGQRALAVADLTAQFKRIARPEGDIVRLADKTGFLHIDEENPGHGRPEVDRVELRRILLESIPAESIHWGHKVASVGPDGPRFTLNFADGSQLGSFDLVVGADGAWSRVRPLLTSQLPFYTGFSSVEFRIADVEERQPDIAKLVGLGSYFCCSDNKALLAQRQGDGSLRTYAMLRVPEFWLDECAFSFPQDKARLIAQYFGDWCDANKSLVLLADDEGITARKLVMLPVGHSWESRPGVTLLGDAAQVTVPSGEGVNSAMVDAMELAEKILDAKGNLAAAVKEYEREMFVRKRKVAEEAIQMSDIMLNETAPIPFKEFMESFGSPPSG